MRQVTIYSKKRLLIVAYITLLALFFNLNTISAQSYTVDNRGVCSNVNASQPYCTIQGAIDDVASGTTITVAPGTYNENIVINRAVNLRGNNADINPNTTARNAETIIRPVVTNPTTATTVYVRSSDVTVNGFQVISGGDPSQQAGIGGYAEVISNVTTSNNIVENYSQHGIRFDSPAPATQLEILPSVIISCVIFMAGAELCLEPMLTAQSKGM